MIQAACLEHTYVNTSSEKSLHMQTQALVHSRTRTHKYTHCLIRYVQRYIRPRTSMHARTHARAVQPHKAMQTIHVHTQLTKHSRVKQSTKAASSSSLTAGPPPRDPELTICSSLSLRPGNVLHKLSHTHTSWCTLSFRSAVKSSRRLASTTSCSPRSI